MLKSSAHVLITPEFALTYKIIYVSVLGKMLAFIANDCVQIWPVGDDAWALSQLAIGINATALIGQRVCVKIKLDSSLDSRLMFSCVPQTT